ncbi:MAG: hypothetical protein NVSMB38_35800 [Ktedonobacteraceae bacterium]
MAQDFGIQEEDGGKLYFLTERRLYELVYKWVNTRDELGQVQPREQWIPQFVGPLQERSFKGAELMRVVKDVSMAHAVLISVAPSDLQNTEGEGTRVEVSEGALPVSLVFVLPSYTSSETQHKSTGVQDHSVSGPSRISSYTPGAIGREHAEKYDVIEINRTWATSVESETQLPYKQAVDHAQTFDDALLFRYYSEANLPPGKKRDTLEWLNPQYVPWQETLGFFFRGLYFETTNVIEVPGEQGSEQVPAEVYLATVFQVERDGPRDVNIYRPFGRREDAIAWINSITHVKASLTRLVPDPGSTNWFVLSDLQNLNSLGFKPQGEVEWLN